MLNQDNYKVYTWSTQTTSLDGIDGQAARAKSAREDGLSFIGTILGFQTETGKVFYVHVDTAGAQWLQGHLVNENRRDHYTHEKVSFRIWDQKNPFMAGCFKTTLIIRSLSGSVSCIEATYIKGLRKPKAPQRTQNILGRAGTKIGRAMLNTARSVRMFVGFKSGKSTASEKIQFGRAHHAHTWREPESWEQAA